MDRTAPLCVLLSEQDFFDKEATDLSEDELAIPTPDQVTRYQTARLSSGNAAKDTLFARLQPLEGKRILDYGCGTGENACLLAACGAQVTGFDLSPQSVAQAGRRAANHGLGARTRFDVAVAGQLAYAPQSFDVVVGFNILHHLHQSLPRIFTEVARLLTPSGMAYFIEPVANSAVLRLLRRLTPVPCEKTPDERQLLYADFKPLGTLFSHVEISHYYFLDRLHRFGIGRYRLLRRADYYIQRALPFLQRYYGMLLVTAALA
jgi:ubiquinone/menaquinone biosynthesis C-methylase UbiE